MNKQCSKCKHIKLILLFSKDKYTKDGYLTQCKLCRSIYRKTYNKLSKDIRKQYNQNNKEKIKKQRKEYRERNKDCIKMWNKEYYKKYKKTVLVKLKFKLKTDPIFKLKWTIRKRTRSIFKAIKENKTINTQKLLGTNWLTVKEHIEKQFKPGMSWDNHSLKGWHIDHIVPLASASNKEELIKLCHYTNLQPLWASENLSKGVKLNYEYFCKES